jgi:translation initiation factor IF-3
MAVLSYWLFFRRNLDIAKQDKRNRLNDDITATEVRLIGADGGQIVPNAEPPVCRIMDYGKFVFEQKKQRQEARKKQKQVHIKEIKFRPGTDIGDYNVKLRSLRKFLEGGDKCKITMRFRGREHAHRELGLEVLERVEKDLEDLSMVEQRPIMEGRQMVMVLVPQRKK